MGSHFSVGGESYRLPQNTGNRSIYVESNVKFVRDLRLLVSSQATAMAILVTQRKMGRWTVLGISRFTTHSVIAVVPEFWLARSGPVSSARHFARFIREGSKSGREESTNRPRTSTNAPTSSRKHFLRGWN